MGQDIANLFAVGSPVRDPDELEPRRAISPAARSEVPEVSVGSPGVPRHFKETVAPAKDPHAFLVPLSMTPALELPKKVGLAGDSATRKAAPVYEGFVCYFPNAMANVARLSKFGNDKHNPGQPLHWSFNLSNDHGNCIVRHQASDPEAVDDSYDDPEILHATAIAWRAMAQLETILLKKYPELKPGKNVVGAR